MQSDEVAALCGRFRSRECTGIASFLEFMQELEPDEQTTVFQLMLTKRVGVKPSGIQDPFIFFTELYKLRERRPLFVDESIKLLDLVCGEVAQWWAVTEHGEQ